MKLLSILSVFLLVGCNAASDQGQPVSFWESQKAKFRYQNKKEFICDSTLRAGLKTKAFTPFRHPLFKSISGDTCYLYSWQDRDPSKNEFVILKDAEELGLQLFYFILDKKDSLLSYSSVGYKSDGGELWFETQSKFISKDTLSKISAITQWYDTYNNQKIIPVKGDTVFSYLAIDKSGKITESTFKEIKEPSFRKVDSVRYKIPKLLGWVSDYEHVFTPVQIRQLDSMLSRFEKETTNEIAIITIDSSSIAKEVFDDYTLAIAKEWGVGKKGINNGVLIAFSAGYRKIRIQNGYGIEAKLTDEETAEILKDYIIPDFKKGNYFEGIKKGLQVIMDAIR